MIEGGLCVITRRVERLGREHRDVAAAALEGGARLIQVRDKELSTRRLFEVVLDIRPLVRAAGARLIVNDRVDIALAAEADGVHVGDEDLPAAQARRLLGPEAIVGVSVASAAEARAAEAAGASYVSVGPIFATGSKPDAGRPIGAAAIGEIKRAVDVPVLAIGGIRRDNAAEMIRAGADGVAVISAVAEAADMVCATAELLRLIGGARPGPGGARG